MELITDGENLVCHVYILRKLLDRRRIEDREKREVSALAFEHMYGYPQFPCQISNCPFMMAKLELKGKQRGERCSRPWCCFFFFSLVSSPHRVCRTQIIHSVYTFVLIKHETCSTCACQTHHSTDVGEKWFLRKRRLARVCTSSGQRIFCDRPASFEKTL